MNSAFNLSKKKEASRAHWLWILGGIVILTALTIRYAPVKKHSTAQALPPSAPQRAENALRELEEANRRSLLPFLRALKISLEQQPARLASVSTHEDEERRLIGQLKEAFAKMREVNRMINRDELRNEIMDILIAKEGCSKMAVQIASDWEYAQKQFGEDQALARVSSIKLLGRAAQLGNMQPLEQAIERVGQKLNASAKWEKGIQYDYEAMIAAYVNAYGVERFLNNPDPFFQIVGISEQTSLAVERGLYDSQMRSVPPERWREKLGHYFAAVQPISASMLN